MKRLLIALSMVASILTGCAPAFAKGPTSPAKPAPTVASSVTDRCHPEPTSGVPHYILGYGSLMQEASKRRTTPDAGPNIPVTVTGFQRNWTDGPPSTSPSNGEVTTTYLNVAVAPGVPMNAAIYTVTAKDVQESDIREENYCRVLVQNDHIRIMSETTLPPDAQVWLYMNQHPNNGPTAMFPIVQSYVDIFVSGCQELETNFKLADFAKTCLSTTSGWNSNWKNDRIYPRRPFIFEQHASAIDKLLTTSTVTKGYYSQIVIE